MTAAEEMAAAVQELAALHGMGPRAVNLLRKGLPDRGLALRAEAPAKGSEVRK